ncbi:MAG: glycoside hydrolase family 5 protein [Oscillospiraceae bacterium]|nr:glycoside hydrolase family 5 protein [Oscillospiraceae bacterium]
MRLKRSLYSAIVAVALLLTLAGCDTPPVDDTGGVTTDSATTLAQNTDDTTATIDTDTDETDMTLPPYDGTMKDISSAELVRDITIGWNLGNTLDAYHSANPSETMHWIDYNNMKAVETAWIGGIDFVTTPALFKRVKDAGFNAVRIPVTWYEMASGAPDYTIREDWMNHVQSIVDMAVNGGMYVILNTHHDEFVMRFDDPDGGEKAVTALWKQIAERFRDYDEKLIFEGLNEPRARTNGWNQEGQWDWSGNLALFKILNGWNQAFVDAVRVTGGNNQKRHLMLATYAAQGRDDQLNNFALPKDPVTSNGNSKFILSVHTYSPFNWAHNGSGSYNGDGDIRYDIERVAERAGAMGVPVIFGEWGTVQRTNHDDRVRHASDYLRIATEQRNTGSKVVMACFWWDNNGDFALVSRRNDIDSKHKEIIDAMLQGRNSG